MWRWPTSIGGRIAAFAVSFLALILGLVAFALGTGPGHAAISLLLNALSQGDVTVHGLSGNLLDNVRAARLELRDANGTWLEADGITIDWHVLPLLDHHVDVQQARIARVVFYRPKIAKPSTSKSSWRIDIDRLAVHRIELKKAAIGHAAVLTAAGTLHYVSRHDLSADISVSRLDAIGEYRVRGSIRHDVASGIVSVAESGDGMLGGFIGLPDIGPVSLEIEAGGHGRLNHVSLQLQAGALRASGRGSIDLGARTSSIDFSLSAPAMHPRPDMSWASLAAEGHIHGAFDRPEVDGTLTIGELSDLGCVIRMLTGRVTGHAGAVDLRLAAAGLRIPGSHPDIFAGAPLVVTGHADLAAAGRPVHLAIDHPLVHASADMVTRGIVKGRATAVLPALAPLARLAGITLDGAASIDATFTSADGTTGLGLNGRISARGTSVLPRLLGDARVNATASVRAGGKIDLTASLAGRAVDMRMAGGTAGATNDYQANLTITDLSRVLPSLIGTLAVHGRINGNAGDMALNVGGEALAATKGHSRTRVAIALKAAGLPKLRSAEAHVSGRFDGAPVMVAATVAPAGGNALKVVLDRADWRSARIRGEFVSTVSGSAIRGAATARVDRLADLSSILGLAVRGRLNATLGIKPGAHRPVAAVHLTVQGLQSGGVAVAQAGLDGTVTDPLGSPVLALTLGIPKFSAPAVSGSMKAKLSGPLNALTIAASSSDVMNGDQPVQMVADALVDLPGTHAVLRSFDGSWQGQRVTLASPATIGIANNLLSVNAEFVDGKSSHIAVKGTTSLKAGGPMNVHVTGAADLARLTSSLASIGESLGGKLAMDVTVTGTAAKPQASGTLVLTNGELRDYTNGVNLTAINATVEAQGDTVRLARFAAKAGPGAVSGSGTVDLASAGMPVNVTFHAKDARPIVSDLITLTLDADLKLAGKIDGGLKVTGTARATQGNINVPQKFPPDVAVLNVRRANTPPPQAPKPPTVIGLDVTFTSPGRIFVRGRGLDVEMAGDLKLTGTTGTPHILGALTMRRGSVSLAGTTLDFQSGKLDFTGAGLRGRLDPALDFVAETTGNGVTATLKVTGTASRPKLELSSSPPLPQDEILAQLLFHQSVKSLSPFQLAQVAQAVASFGGVGSGFDPVGAMRRSLGLDKLSIGSTQSTAGSNGQTSIEAGKYVLHNVYVGASQDLSGGTRAIVQVDITKNLKAQATVRTGTRATAAASTPLQDNGDTLGLSYQFEY